MPENDRLSWFPLYVDRFLNSRRLRRFNAEKIGIFILLLVEEWEGGPLPMDMSMIMSIGRAEHVQIEAVLKQCFKQTEDGWINEELEAIRAEQKEKHRQKVEAGRLGGLASGRVRQLSMDMPTGSTAQPLEKNRIEKNTTPPPKSPPSGAFEKNFFSFWDAYPLKVGRKRALKAYQAQRRKGTTHEQIMDGLARYLAWATATDTILKHPATFLGPDDWWEEPWQVTEADQKRQRGNGPTEPVLDPKFKENWRPVIQERKPHPELGKQPGNIQELPEPF